MVGFRWILLGLGLLLLLGIWWSGRRGPSQARGPALRAGGERPAGVGGESQVMPAQPQPDPLPIRRELPIPPFGNLKVSPGTPAADGTGLDIPVLSSIPDSIDPIQLLPLGVGGTVPEIPLVNAVDARQEGRDGLIERPEIAPEPAAPPSIPVDPPPPSPIPAGVSPGTVTDAQSAVPETHLISGRFSRREPRTVPRTDTSGRFAKVKPDVPKPVQLQKIISVRVLALADEGWAGEDVAAALAGSDLVHGRYGVFHRLHRDGRTVFHVASLIEPGNFDPARMPEQTFPGLSVFAILPGPMLPLDTLEEMLGGARQIAIDLAGTVQDEQGQPLTPLRAGQLRDEMRDFQARLQQASAQ